MMITSTGIYVTRDGNLVEITESQVLVEWPWYGKWLTGPLEGIDNVWGEAGNFFTTKETDHRDIVAPHNTVEANE